MITENYRKMAQQEFDDTLQQVVGDHKSTDLMYIPGVWEILSEHFNNEVLDRWEKQQ